MLGYFDALVGRGLTEILREDQDLRIIDTDVGNSTLENVVVRRAPQVVILDEASTVNSSVLERLRAVQPAIGIIVLVHRPTRTCGMRLLAAGASCVSKDASAAKILAAVHIAPEGRRLFAPADGRLVERSYPAKIASLTPRETEVLEYLSRGQSHAEIAHALRLGVETIRTHSARIPSKLGVRSKRELIGVTIPVQSETEDP